MKEKRNLLLGTRKGLVVYSLNHNDSWVYQTTHFVGAPVSLTFVDPRSNTWFACLDHGHWGVKLHRSEDNGENWTELESPKFEEGLEIKEGKPATVNYLWAMAHGGYDRQGVLYLGTDPGALFYTEDNGESWKLVEGLWNHSSRVDGWFGGGRDDPGIHSILVDPRDSDHIYVAISVAGVFETTDGGTSWSPANKGLSADFLPDPTSEIGQDPHLLAWNPKSPEVMWQQNHCGIFISKDGSQNWRKVSQKKGPADFGFAIAVDPGKPSTAWVVPGISDELRIPVDNGLCVCRTDDFGKSWKVQKKGLPQHSFDVVYRHSLDVNGEMLAFGTTTGNVYWSSDKGDSWETITNNLAMVYSVEFT